MSGRLPQRSDVKNVGKVMRYRENGTIDPIGYPTNRLKKKASETFKKQVNNATLSDMRFWFPSDTDSCQAQFC